MKRISTRLKNFFVPHEGNNHRPHVLRARFVAVACLIAVVAEGLFLFGTSYLGPRSRLFGIIVVSALTDETNAARVSTSLPELHVSPLLQAAAQEKADDMVKNNYFAHTSPSGLTPWYWFENVGYSFSYAGENLAVNFSDSGDVTNAWLNSPEHRANIMNVNFTQIGIATAEGTFQGQPAMYVVEDFGTPSIAPVVTLPSDVTPGTPVTQPVVVKSLVAPVAPAVIATSSVVSSSSNQSFVAVKGAETQTTPLTNATSAQAAGQSVQPQTVVQTPSTAAPEINLVQDAFANPRASLDDMLYFMALFFVFALGLNVFIKIRIQHPDLILGSVIAISLAGIFILVNQQVIIGTVIR